MWSRNLIATIVLMAPAAVISFIAPWVSHKSTAIISSRTRPVLSSSKQTVTLEPWLDDDKVTKLFAWVSRAFVGEPRYDNLMLAIAAIFGDLPDDSPPMQMLAEAMTLLPPEEEAVGDSYSWDDRESASLGAMGAGQWTGQYRTRPHALLTVKNITSVDEWVKGLPRGCRRTLKKADAQNFTIRAMPIEGGSPAPHSSLAHFRCVVAHEVRLLSYGANGFFDALAEGVSRYVGTTRMAGEIREYRNADGKVIAFAHEVRKGRTIRGQWFYAGDEAAKSYVWFHSVQDLVRRAIEADGVDVVDLGPSGSDAFSELKQRYGFASVVDWPAVADYQGPFYYGENEDKRNRGNGLASIFEMLMERGSQ
mmetsp:Transcript_14640/g.21631  ORF Transcript_14640/g.21631 Transcript_14640/m.21631 type:complete len:364 (+) Transcript_14640:105-1196(+)|eukprot:CAMPEP_0195518044 /NCGR_PEP_ID=MMETSP0794_2-20130614/12029_1 /TAXON_ID=515487 /ORGANISM="Stephanopyxis turris, Strain CCMP 815" /LENGTH=363 /DNA_ID=CAMNT_0040646943 /DNA_START=104 /DNA_END=1198 /DNA_ORIENTATION=-